MLHSRTKSKDQLNKTLQEDLRRKRTGNKTYTQIGMNKKMNKTQYTSDSLTSELDEVLIVEVQLGENNKKQI